MTFVKICGLREAEHVRAARDADAVGFVVASPKSPRNLAFEEAAVLARAAEPLPVAVTAARDAPTLLRIVRETNVLALQAPHDAQWGPVRAAHPRLRILAACRPESVGVAPQEADLVVLDAATEEGYGGTGARLDPAIAIAAARASRRPVVLAGGLAPENVADALRAVRPFGVDVSSGVETGGRKDPRKIAKFVENARRAMP